MSKYNTVIACPSCDKLGKHISKGWFACPDCGGSWLDQKYADKIAREHTCAICNTLAMNGEYHENLPRWRAIRHGYFHPECYEKYLRNIEYEDNQLNEEIKQHDALKDIPCPHCGETEAICLMPGGNYEEDDAVWSCLVCETDISEDYIADSLSKKGVPPLKCLRCGIGYKASSGHRCEEESKEVV